MDNTQLIPNRYYWVKDESSYKTSYTPFFFNVDQKWKIVAGTLMCFVSTATIEKMFGKNCFMREVDFELDIQTEPQDIYLQLLPFAISSDDDIEHKMVILKNSFSCLVDATAFPADYFTEGDFLYFNPEVVNNSITFPPLSSLSVL